MPIGRAPKYKKDFHIEDFIKLSQQGKTFAQIASRWQIDRTTLYRWEKKYPEFRNAVKSGRDLCEAWYIDLGQSAMLGIAPKINGQSCKVNLGWYVWLTKNMFKWNDRASLEHSGPDGRPIETINKPELTDEQLEAEIQKRIEKVG